MAATDRIRLGIVTGSGPDAGIDLWQQVLDEVRQTMGSNYGGDLDAPHIVVVSEPQLGLSMDLEAHYEDVWQTLEGTLRQLAPQVDAYGIACNTLNQYEDRISALNLSAKLISPMSAVEDFVREESIANVALVGAKPVMEMGAYSAYQHLPDIVDVTTDSNLDDWQQLIFDVKRIGPDAPSVEARYAELLGRISADTILLACTELPLIKAPDVSARLVDVTRLLARALARLHLDRH